MREKKRHGSSLGKEKNHFSRSIILCEKRTSSFLLFETFSNLFRLSLLSNAPRRSLHSALAGVQGQRKQQEQLPPREKKKTYRNVFFRSGASNVGATSSPRFDPLRALSSRHSSRVARDHARTGASAHRKRKGTNVSGLKAALEKHASAFFDERNLVRRRRTSPSEGLRRAPSHEHTPDLPT